MRIPRPGLSLQMVGTTISMLSPDLPTTAMIDIVSRDHVAHRILDRSCAGGTMDRPNGPPDVELVLLRERVPRKRRGHYRPGASIGRD